LAAEPVVRPDATLLTVLSDPRLTDGAKVLFAWAAQRGWPGDRWPSRRQVAGEVGVCEKTVKRRVEELQRAGLLDAGQVCPGQRCPGPSRARSSPSTSKASTTRPQPPPPPWPTRARETAQRQEEEDGIQALHDGATATETALVEAGADAQDVNELAALGVGDEARQGIERDAWQTTAARARQGTLRCPEAYMRACVRNGTKALALRLRDRAQGDADRAARSQANADLEKQMIAEFEERARRDLEEVESGDLRARCRAIAHGREGPEKGECDLRHSLPAVIVSKRDGSGIDPHPEGAGTPGSSPARVRGA